MDETTLQGSIRGQVKRLINEAAETIVWLEMAQRCNYIEQEQRFQLEDNYREIIGQLVKMTNQAEQWLVKEEEAIYKTDRRE